MTPIEIFYLISNVIIIPSFGLLAIFLMIYLIPRDFFDSAEMNEIRNNFLSRPLLNIEKYSYNRGGSNLFGRYKGFNGGHKYKNCDHLFSGTCKDSEQYETYCPRESTQNEEDRKKVDKKNCFNYTEIKGFPYNLLRDSYYYSTKMRKTYNNLLNETVNKNEQCPFSKKSCGFLNIDRKLCLSIDEICPINDIIINSQATYMENGITYNSLEFGSDYIHYTNEKENNYIIFDLIISLENPLSKIEVGEKLYKKNKLKLHELENDTYYEGDIDKYFVYKKLFNTEMTLEELFKLYDKLDTIKSEPDYKTEYLKSKIFIYKKYPVPLNDQSMYDIHDIDNKYRNIEGYYLGTCIMLFLSLFLGIFYVTPSSVRSKIICYILLTLIDIIVILFFSFSSNAIFHPGILVYYPEKNHHRIQYLVLFIFLLIAAAYQNLSTLYVLIKIYKEEKEEKESKRIYKGKGADTPLFPM